MTTPPPRRGAPFGNTNRLKHGLYARLLHQRALKAAGAIPFVDLQPDLDLVRYLTRRVHAERVFSQASSLPASPEAETTFLLLLLARALRLASPNPDLPVTLETAFAQLLEQFQAPNPALANTDAEHI